MILGEICNFAGKKIDSLDGASMLKNAAAYAFVEALVVVRFFFFSFYPVQVDPQFFKQTPMGALSVVVCAILSSIFLKEKLTFFGWLGCALCIVRFLLYQTCLCVLTAF